MGRWKSRGGKSQGREEKKKEDQRRERVRRKKMQVREKVATSRNTVFFRWFVAPEGRKVCSLKRRVRSHLARWEMKSCTPLWREARFQVKMYKTPQLRNTFRTWDVEKVHAVVAGSTCQTQNVQNTPGRTFGSWDVQKVQAAVARSTFRSQSVQNTPAPEHFWKLRCSKSARRCGAKHISKPKVLKSGDLGALFQVRWFCVAGATSSGTEDFSETSLNFRSWQHQKQSNSARLLSIMESWVQRWRPRTNGFCDFSSPCVQSTAPATKKWGQVTRSAATVKQNHLSKPEDLMLQNATRLRNQRSDLLTSLMTMSLVLRLPREMHLRTSSSNAPRPIDRKIDS